MIHRMRIRTEGLILFQVLTLAHLWISNRLFSSCNKDYRLIKILLMFHHQIILYLNFLPLCFQLEERSEEKKRKKKKSLVNCSSFLCPYTALVFLTYLWKISHRSLPSSCDCLSTCLYFIISSFQRKLSITIMKVIYL